MAAWVWTACRVLRSHNSIKKWLDVPCLTVWEMELQVVVICNSFGLSFFCLWRGAIWVRPFTSFPTFTGTSVFSCLQCKLVVGMVQAPPLEEIEEMCVAAGFGRWQESLGENFQRVLDEWMSQSVERTQSCFQVDVYTCSIQVLAIFFWFHGRNAINEGSCKPLRRLGICLEHVARTRDLTWKNRFGFEAPATHRTIAAQSDGTRPPKIGVC